MTVEQAIKIDNNWKELVNKVIDENNNFDDFTKDLMKLVTELKHEYNKSTIINKYQYEEAIKKIIDNNNH